MLSMWFYVDVIMGSSGFRIQGHTGRPWDLLWNDWVAEALKKVTQNPKKGLRHLDKEALLGALKGGVRPYGALSCN